MRYDECITKQVTHCEATKITAFSAFKAGYGAALFAILRYSEARTNLALTDLRDCQDQAFSIYHRITGEKME